MKRCVILLFMILVTVMVTNSATVSYKKYLTENQNLIYDSNCDCCVFGQWDDCHILPVEDIEIGEILRTSNGYELNLDLNSVKIQVKQPSGLWIEHIRDGNNYTFTEFEVLEIIECQSYPELENRIIPLAGITTDFNGNYTIILSD